MIIERTDTEILIRLPLNSDFRSLQKTLEFFKLNYVTSKSEAKEEQIEELVKSVNSKISKKVLKDSIYR